MLIELLKGKVHRAKVTDADIEYVGSLTLDEELAKAAGMVQYEKISVWNVTNGNRLDTYLMYGERGKKECVINGAAARLMHKGDIVIISSYCQLDPKEAQNHQPHIVVVNEKNEITSIVNTENVLA